MQLKKLYIISCFFIFSCSNGNKTNKPSNDLIDTNYITLSDTIINNIHVCTEMLQNTDSIKIIGKPASGIIISFWERTRKELYVSFIDGDITVQEKVKQVAKEWENYCGKEFVFIDNMQTITPDITISFKDKSSWSLVGKNCRNAVPSMNLGWLTTNTSDEEYRRVVLHEFGHALGLVHEHQNPNNQINWSKDTIYAFYKQKFGWPKRITYANFFEKYNANQMNSTEFDSLSIMLYEIPSLFTTDGFHTKSNYQLSETDKKWIATIYPKK